MTKQAKIKCPHCSGSIIVRIKEGASGEAEALIDQAFDLADKAFDTMDKAFKKIFGR